MAFVAVIDANVLWSAALRDTLVRAALADLYRPVWTDEILAEMLRNLKRKRPELNPARLDRTVDLLRAEVPDARQTRPDCPAALAVFFAGALALERSKRPQSALEFASSLRAIV